MSGLHSPVTGRGWAVGVLGLVLAVAGFRWHYGPLAGLGLALLVLLALELVAVLTSGRVEARRVVEPLVVPRGGACTGVLHVVRRRGLLPVRLSAVEPVGDREVVVAVAEDPVVAARPGAGATRVGTGAAGAGERARGGAPAASYAIPTARRGALHVGPLRLGREGPAGLVRRTDLVGEPVVVRVLPGEVPLRGLPAGRRRTPVGADERVEHGGTDLVGLHEYVPGDDLRRLHWATTARTGTLMVRDDADPAQPRLLLLLDDRGAAYADGGDDLEEAVDLVNSLAQRAVRDGRQVRVRAVSGRLDVESSTDAPGAAVATAHEVAVALSDVEPVDRLGGPPAPADRDRDTVVVVTGAAASTRDLLVTLGDAADGALLVLDPRPGSSYAALGTVTELRAPTARELAALWDRRVTR